MSSVTDSFADEFGLDESVTVTVKEKVPAVVGVPDSRPSGLTDMPWGSAPVSLQVKGPTPPLGATNVKAGYATPVAPGGGGGEVALIVSWEELAPPPPHPASPTVRVNQKTDRNALVRCMAPLFAPRSRVAATSRQRARASAVQQVRLLFPPRP